MKLGHNTSMFAILASAAVSTTAQAQDPAAQLSEIVVTASRSGSVLSDLPTSVSVVSNEQLGAQLSYSTNIMRALEYAIPGLAPQRDTRSNCSPNIRGRATSIQINGIPVNEELRESTCDQMYQLSPFAIERVEVLRGGTALYGAGSPGGIVNFITRRAGGERLEVDAVAQASFNTSRLDHTLTSDLYLGAGQAWSDWDYYVGAAYADGGAARTPDGGLVPSRTYESLTLNGSLGVMLGGGELRSTGTYYSEDKDQQYSADGTQVAGERFANVIAIDGHPQLGQNLLRSTTLALAYNHPDVLGQALSLSVYHQDQIYRQRDNFYNVNFGGNDFFASDSEHDRTGFRSTLVKKATLGGVELVGSYGFDFTRNSYYRPAIDPADDGRVFGFVAPEVVLDTRALFGQAELDFGALRIVGGARQEWYRGKAGDRGFDPALPGAATPGKFGESDLVLLNLGAVYEVSDAIQLYGGFSQGAELSELGRAARGINEPSRVTPEPATSDQVELGIRGRSGPLRFELGGFRSTSDKAALLQPDPSCAGQSLCPLIPLRARQRFWGLEASADLKASERLDLAAVVTWQRGEIFDEGLGRFIQYSTDTIAPFRVSGSASYRPIESLRLSLQGAYYGAADFYSVSEQALGFVNTDAVFLMDASAHYRVGAGELFVAASNLLDEEYVNVADQAFGDFFYYQAEGRRVTLGYKARF